jgi:hypothetical protein
MNLACVALAILTHFLFDKLIGWIIPDSMSRIRELLTEASVLAFGSITLYLLAEMVWTFAKYRTPSHSTKAALSMPVSTRVHVVNGVVVNEPSA